LVALGFAVVLLIVFLPALLSTGVGRDVLVGAVSAYIAGPVELDAVSLSWNGTQRIEGLRIGPAPTGPASGKEPGQSVVEVRRATVETGLLALAFSTESELKIEVEEPVLRVSCDQEGRLNLSDLLVRRDKPANGSAKTGKATGKGNEKRSPTPPTLLKRKVSLGLKEGSIEYRDEGRDGTVMISGLHVNLIMASPTLSLDVRGAVTLEGLLAADDHKGTSRQTGSLDLHLETTPSPDGELNPETLHSRGKLEALVGVTYQGWTVGKVVADLGSSAGEWYVENLEAELNGGRAVADRLAVDVKTNPYTFQGLLRLEAVAVNYEMAEMLAYVLPFLGVKARKAVFSGQLNGDLELRGKGFGREDLERSLEGKGRVRVREGEVSASPFFHELAKVVRVDLKRVQFAEIGSDFDIADGEVAASKVFLTGRPESRVRNLGFTGTTGFDGQIDFGVDLSLISQTVGDKKIRRLLDDAIKILGSSQVPVRLTGTLSDPKIAFQAGKVGKGLRLDGLLELFGK
jgi:hypothetical protein